MANFATHNKFFALRRNFLYDFNEISLSLQLDKPTNKSDPVITC